MYPIFIPPITDAHIELLRLGAQHAGDHITAWKCEIALGRCAFNTAPPELNASAQAHIRGKLVATLAAAHIDEITRQLTVYARRHRRWSAARAAVAS